MSSITLTMTEDPKMVYFSGKTFSYKDIIKAIPGNKWNKKSKRWEIPVESVEDAVRIMPTIGLEDQVKFAYKALIDRNKRAVATKSLDESKVTTTVAGLKGQLYPYQAVGKAFLDTLGPGEGGILAFDMGLGKSLTSLASFLDYKRRGIVDHLLVVCPSTLRYTTWKKEVEKWTELEYIVIDGTKSEKVEWDDGTIERLKGQNLREVQYQQWEQGVDVTIMNYELFLRDMDIMPDITDRWMVVLDEAHRIKNPKAQTTKNLMKKVAPAGRKILGSGTPLENNIMELWTLVDLCRPGLLGNYYKFINRYMELDFFNQPVAPKPQMMDELRRKIDPIMIRKTKEEALPDLPPLEIIDYKVQMTKEQKRIYKEVKEGILEIQRELGVDFTYLEALAQLTRLQQLCDSPALLRKVYEDDTLPVESGKLNELKSIVTDIDPEKNKFILFSQYSEMTDILYKWLQEEGILRADQIGYIKGGTKATETERIQTGFQEGGIQCVLMTTAGNYGLDLYKGKYVVCYDQLFNPQKMAQIYARAHRNGNLEGVTAINLITEDSYEEKKLEILQIKKELFGAVVDNDEQMFKKLFDTPQDLMALL